MVGIYNINKFVTSCGGGWLIQAGRIEGVFLLLVFSSRCWVQVVKVVVECFFFFPRLPSPSRRSLPSCCSLSVCYSTCGYWTYERMKGGFRGIRGRCWGNNEADGGTEGSPQVGVLGRRCFFCRWRAEVELSFCCRPRRSARVEGCSNSSDKLAPVTRSSAFWSLIGSDCTCETRWDEADILKKGRREIQVLTGGRRRTVKSGNLKMEGKYKGVLLHF